MSAIAIRARRAIGLGLAIALAIVQGAIAQGPPAATIEIVASSATTYDVPAVSADGRHVAFITDATLSAVDTNIYFDIYVRDRVLGITTLVSATDDGMVSNGASASPSISADGRFIAFGSSATNLVPGDSNNVDDIFVHDRDSDEDGVFDEPEGTTLTRVSVDTDGIQSNCASYRPSVSSTGRFVAFDSCVTNWAVVAGKTLTVHDIFVHDRDRAVTVWANPPAPGSANGFNNHHSGDASISADGRYVAFASQATTQPQTLNDFGSSQIYVRDTCLGAPGICEEATAWASPQVHVDYQPSAAFEPSISGNGRWVAFESDSTVHVAGDTNDARDIFVFDRDSNGVTRVNVSNGGEQALTVGPSTCSMSRHATISGDGRLVTFESCANNLVADDTLPFNFQDVFLHDRDRDGNGSFDDPGGTATTLITRNPAGAPADNSSTKPAISSDGMAVAFSSSSRDIAPTAVPIGVYVWTAGNSTNAAPTANAGSDQSVAATGSDEATLTLDGSASSDPDGDPLTFTWAGPFGVRSGVTVSPSFGVGTHTVMLTVDDGRGGTATDAVEITVTAAAAPVEISILESIVVSDGPVLTPSALVDVSEPIGVTDSVGVQPSATLSVTEAILVADTPELALPDTTPPVLTLPDPVIAAATSANGAAVFYTATATDLVDGRIVPLCLPASGSRFPIGLTTVACTATDSSGNVASGGFTVTVTAFSSAPTATTLSSSRNPSLTTAPPIFTATVTSSGSSSVSGHVEFRLNGVAIGTSPLLPRATQFVAIFGGAMLDAGGSPHTITARYLGDATHQSSDSAPLQQTVQAGTFFNEVISGPPAGFAPVALNDAGRIAGNRGNATLSRAGVFDPSSGFRNLFSLSDYSQALDINAAGVVVGRAGLEPSTTSGFVDRNGVLEPIADSRAATGINGREQIALNLADGMGTAIYHNGGLSYLELFEARAINDAGAVAGAIVGASGQPVAALWQDGAITELGLFGLTSSAATHVTNDGTLLIQGSDASSENQTFLYRDGIATPLGAFRAWDINDAGSIVGGTSAATVYLGGSWHTLGNGTVGGMAINHLGQIAGSVSNQLRLWTPVPTSILVVNPVTGFADDDTTLTATLTSNGAPAAGYTITFSLNGQSVGSAMTNADGVAVLGDVSLCCLAIGVHPDGVRATFAGNRTLGEATATAQLTVDAVNPADAGVTATTPSAVVTLGSNVTYFVAVANHGPSFATVLRLSVTLPAGLQYVSDSGAGACTWAAGLGTCEFNNVTAGTTRAIVLVAQMLATTPRSASFVVSALQHDPVPANNAALVMVDARPTVTINQATSQSDPATLAPVNFTVAFSEPVTGFGPTDVAFAGSTVGGTLAASVTGSGATYNVAVHAMTGVGIVRVSIPAGAAIDSGGIPSAASTSTDATVLFGVASVVALVTPGNGGSAALTVLRAGNSLNGLLFYTRGGVQLMAARFTSLVIDGQTATMEGFSTANRFFIVSVRDGGPGQADTFRLWIDGVEQTAGGSLSSGIVVVQPWMADTRLKGWVDLHTHPMSNLAFGGKLFHGAPSAGSLMPAVQMPGDPQCRFDQRATGINDALSQDGPTRGDALQSSCGDFTRNVLIRTLELANGATVAPAGADGYPAFTHWPKWSDISHQKMWVDWIRRSWEGGQRVMVALSHNNRTLAELLGGGGPISGVRNDRASSDLQIDEIKQLVGAYPEFMAVATTPAELHGIVQGGRMAVVLGVEIDKIGDFSTTAVPSLAAIDAEIARLHSQGVRYILPVHLADNAFGDAALYQPLFNIVNFRENGAFFTVGCAQYSDEIGFQSGGIPPILAPFLLPGMPVPVAPNCVTAGVFRGHVNSRTTNGLTTRGEYAIRAMMRRGIIVDIDHMSDRAANRTLAIANAVPGGGYPVTSGHSGVRQRTASHVNAENMRNTTQLARIACLGGMFGLGTDTAGAHRWALRYQSGYDAMRRAFAPNGLCPNVLPLGAGFMGLGTDANSLVKTPVPPMLDPAGPARFADIYNPGHPLNAGVPQLFKSTTGAKTWDYNVDGVAHYGMFVDFLRDVRMFNVPGAMPGRQIVDDQMMYGADYFYRMWLKAEALKASVP